MALERFTVLRSVCMYIDMDLMFPQVIAWLVTRVTVCPCVLCGPERPQFHQRSSPYCVRTHSCAPAYNPSFSYKALLLSFRAYALLPRRMFRDSYKFNSKFSALLIPLEITKTGCNYKGVMHFVYATHSK